MNNDIKIDKSLVCCATCAFWGGCRQFDGIGCFTYNMNNPYGNCNQVGWKGFSGSKTNAIMQCPDYDAQQK